MGGDKTGRGKKIPRDESATSSTRSMQTPFGGQEEGVSSRKGGVDGGVAGDGVANSRTQIPESGICSPSVWEESGEERASSHKYATTSWRCGFEWVDAL